MKVKIGFLPLVLALFVLLVGVGPVPAQGKIVSLNKASAQELMAIEGVNLPEDVAKNIVKHREQNGPFKSADDLLKVQGMTNNFLERLNPVERNGDLVHDPDAEPVLAPSKC